MGVAASIVLVVAGLWSWGHPAGAPSPAPAPIFDRPPDVPDSATTSGSMDKSIIRGVIRDHINEVKVCYEAELAVHPRLFGQIMVQFTIGATGEVVKSVLQTSTMGSPSVESCTVKAVKTWRFPRPRGGGVVIVSYPFLLTPHSPIELVEGSNGANRVELQPVRARMVVHRSTDARAIPSNGLIAITEHGLLLIDTAWTPSQTEAILRWGDERLKQPWIGAVITHDHADRDGGLEAVLRRRIPVSAIDLTVEKLQRRGVGGVSTLFSARVGEVHVKDDRGFEAFYPGPGHAADNIVVKFESLLFGGCLIKSAEADDLGFTGDADLRSWPGAVRRVQERYGKTIVVPGHGPVDESATGAAYENTLRLLEKTRSR
jgi:metallo-beta-lactamase class B